MLDRKRHVDVEKVELSELTELTDRITSKITKITQKAIEDANTILNIYGMEAEMQIAIKNKTE